jgi:hypothetical protein
MESQEITENQENENQEKDNQAGNENEGNPFEGIAELIIEEMPEVSEHVIENERTKAEQESQQKSFEKPLGNGNESGEVFNPEIHCTDENGNPILTKTGKYRKRPGKKSGQSNKNTRYNSTLGNQGQAENQPENDGRAQSILLAKMGSKGLAHFREVISDLKAEENEVHFLEEIIKDWADETGASVNPNTALVLGCSIFMLPAIKTKKTQNIFSRGFGFIKGLFFRKSNGGNLKQKDDEKTGEN